MSLVTYYSVRMKTNHFFVLILVTLFTISPLPLQAGIEAEVKRVNHTVFFYNIADTPGATPFMSIIFNGIPKKEVANVNRWRNEISEKLQELGGVITEKDYGKLTKIIPDYAPKFIETGAIAVAIEFPRKKQGLLLYRKK